MANWQFFADFIPEESWAPRTAVIVTENDPAGFDDGEGLSGLSGKPRKLVASIAEDHLGRSSIRSGIPSVHAREDLPDLGLQGLLPVEVADIVLTGDGWEVKRDHFSVRRQMQSDVERGSAFSSTEFHDASWAQECDDAGQAHKLVRHGAEITRKRIEQFGRAAEVELGKQVLGRNLRNLQIGAPGQAAPFPGQTVTGVKPVRLCDVFHRWGRSLGEEDAQGIQVKRRQTVQGAPHAMLQSSIWRHAV